MPHQLTHALAHRRRREDWSRTHSLPCPGRGTGDHARPSEPAYPLGQSRVVSDHLGPRPPVKARLEGSEKAPRKVLELTTPARPKPAAGKTRGLPSSCAAECSAREYCDEKPTFINND